MNAALVCEGTLNVAALGHMTRRANDPFCKMAVLHLTFILATFKTALLHTHFDAQAGHGQFVYAAANHWLLVCCQKVCSSAS